MYVLPKALESAWIMLRGKGIVFKTGRYGDTLVGILYGFFGALFYAHCLSARLAHCRWDGYGHGESLCANVTAHTNRCLVQSIYQVCALPFP